MSREDNDIQNSLAPPGAGLPVIQAFVLRHLFFPAYCLDDFLGQSPCCVSG